MSTSLTTLVEASDRTARTASRLAKRDAIAAVLHEAQADEVEVAVAFLSGEIRQGRIGVGWATLSASPGAPASEASLTLADVDAAFARVAATAGKGSAAGRAARLKALFERATGAEQDFLLRLLAGELRQGALEGVMLDAIATAARLPAADVGEVKVYTRALKDVTASAPEIVEALRALPAQELILDGEAVALAGDGAPLPFQATMRRFGRKLDVEAMRSELPLAVFFFDCLHFDGTPLLDAPAQARFDALAAALPPALVIPRIVTADVATAEAFYADALARGHEGVMAKALGAPYKAGRRGAGWLKVKRAHTLDLVVLAAEWGHGRRKGWLSNLHLGARDPDRSVAPTGWVVLGKTFKGMTDALLDWQTRELLARESVRDSGTVWVRPELVVEIAFNDLQASPPTPVGWHCASPASRATARTSGPTKPTPSRRCGPWRQRRARRASAERPGGRQHLVHSTA